MTVSFLTDISLCMNSGYGLMAVTGRALIHIQGHKAVLTWGHAKKPFRTLHYLRLASYTCNRIVTE